MGFKNRKYRFKVRSSHEESVLNETNNLLHYYPLKKRKTQHYVSETKCNAKLDQAVEEKVKQRYYCKKCYISYKYKKNLVRHYNKKHSESDALSKSIEDKENRLCIRRLSICLEKLKDKDIPASSKELLLKQQNKEEENKDTFFNQNENKFGELSCISVQQCSQMSISSEKRIKCSQCQAQLSGELEFEKHFESVHSLSKDKLIECSHCLEVFAESEDLFWHCRTAHFQLRLHKCPDCEVMSLDKGQITQHISLFHKKPVFECWVCDLIFNVEENFIQHFNEKHFL